MQIFKQFKKKVQNNSQTHRTATAKAVNKLFCSELDATTAPLFHRQPGSSPLWPGCYITTDDSQSSNLMALRANEEFTGMLQEGRWRMWTRDCGPEVSVPVLPA